MEKFHRNILVISAFVYLVTAWFSVGFHHFDEHYQIIEFAGYKLGFNSADHLAWEYDAQIRPGLQPTIAFIILSVLQWFSVNDPFTQAFFIRVISAAVSLLVLRFFVKTSLDHFNNERNKKLFILLSYLLYFIPFLAVRFSSETWSALALLAALAFLQRYSEHKRTGSLWMMGVFLALSFQFRYQAGIMIFFLGLWLLLFNFDEIKKWLLVAASFVLCNLLCAGIDHWFYGQWTFPYLGYFETNLIQNKAAEFGVEPWWWYFTKFFGRDYIALLHGFLLFFHVLFFVRRPKHIITWLYIPFLLVHCFIGHKEYRFIFPLAFFVSYIVTDSVQYAQAVISSAVIRKRIGVSVTYILLFLNVVFLFVSTLSPAWGPVKIYAYLAKQQHRECALRYNDWRFFFLDQKSTLKTHFYYQGKTKGVYMPGKRGAALDSFNYSDRHRYIICEESEYIDTTKWEMVYEPTPPWLRSINKDNWMKMNAAHWRLYKRKE